jgi:hypothetical protein
MLFHRRGFSHPAPWHFVGNFVFVFGIVAFRRVLAVNTHKRYITLRRNEILEVNCAMYAPRLSKSHACFC